MSRLKGFSIRNLETKTTCLIDNPAIFEFRTGLMTEALKLDAVECSSFYAVFYTERQMFNYLSKVQVAFGHGNN